MPVNPHIKGGSDVPVTDGGTGASDAASGLTNLGGLDSAAHAVVNHAGIPGVGDLTTAAHLTTDHTGIPGIGGGMIFIEKKEILAPVTTVTFAGLDGNADGIYVLHYYCVAPSGVPTFFYLKPNGIHFTTSDRAVLAAAYAHQVEAGIMRIAYTTVASHRCYSVTNFWARAAGPGATPLGRLAQTSIQLFGGRNLHTGWWSDTSTNITSLVIEANLANGHAVGSTMSLYKLVI
jgi:hypothetical protein